MKYSIKTKMFLILMVTTLCSFLLLLLGFNFLINSHIQKESSSDLNKAASVATA